MNVVIFLYLLVISPKLMWQRIRGKRHPRFKERIGLSLPQVRGPVIWIHAISVGEIKAAGPLLKELKNEYPDTQFLVTTTTETGQKEAKSSLKEADFLLYAPLDLSFVVQRWVKRFKPQQFILVESDFWPNLLKALKENKTQISLVSGKISEKSFKRFQKFPSLSKKLFSHFDQICVQNELYRGRFLKLSNGFERVRVTGNLKLDLSPQNIKTSLKLPDQSIIFSCTHDSEEEAFLNAFLDSEYFLVFAPRHPERFPLVADLLNRKKISFSRWEDRKTLKRALLVDAMGKLPSCYKACRVAVLGGSFVPHIGGHNILEPLLYGTPVLFGPHMQAQIEFKNRAIESGAGKEVSLKTLRKTVDAFFEHSEIEKQMRRQTKEAILNGRGSTHKTLNAILNISRQSLQNAAGKNSTKPSREI